MRNIIALAATVCLLAGLGMAQEAAEPSPAEKRAVGYIHTVVTAEREYKKKHGQYAPSLAALIGKGSFTRRMATADRGDYTVRFSGGGRGFAVALTPKTFDAEHRAFFANEGGIVRVEPDKPATAASPVLREH